MKQYLIAALLTAGALSGAAQGQSVTKSTPAASCPKVYLGLNGGINNQNGIVGLSVDVPVVRQISLGTGVGLSSWGWKFFGEARFYPSATASCHRKWAIGVGITHNTGIKDLELELETKYYGKQNVKLDANSATNAFISGYYFWTVGKRSVNRFYTQLGLSLPVTKATYTLEDPAMQLSDAGDRQVMAISPGGIVIGIGWYFSLSN